MSHAAVIFFDTVNELRENFTREGCLLEGTLYMFSLVLSVLMCGFLSLLFFVVYIVVDRIKICDRKLTTQTKHAFLITVSC
jgi:hypothetical protein